jgi:plastocyanin domain-containing protein
MGTDQLIVTIAGIALVAFIVWFFFGPRATTAARTSSAGAQEVEVSVSSSYAPDRIEVQAGRPVRIKFRRSEPNPCTDQVVFPDFGVVRDLPLGRDTVIEVTPPAPGEYQFHCGMNMVKGKLIAK